MRGLIFYLALVVLPGCIAEGSPLPTYGETRPIEADYRPLVVLSERPDLVLSSTAITTVGTTAYVVDLDAWLTKHPPGSSTYHALMLHEQEHSKRQLDYGTLRWVGRYVNDASFMWAEEQRGYYHQIIALRNAGQFVNVDGLAAAMVKYKTVGGTPMVELEAAKVWIRQVLLGQWTPPP